MTYWFSLRNPKCIIRHAQGLSSPTFSQNENWIATVKGEGHVSLASWALTQGKHCARQTCDKVNTPQHDPNPVVNEVPRSLPRSLHNVRSYLLSIYLTVRDGAAPPSNYLPNMSNKITGKNLHYDQTLPPFLARLKGQHAADADSPDPILASRRRQAKPRSASEDAEDAPLIVDDDGNVVAGVEVAADGTVTANPEEAGAEGEDGDSKGAGGGKDAGLEGKEGASAGREDKVATIGGSKKRKVGKVVGADVDDDEREDHGLAKEEKVSAKGQDKRTAADEKTKAPAKAKKKAKKIKLSFGDDDGD